MQKRDKIVGTLMPLFALPESDFFSAQTFLDWLEKTNQNAWLLLPLHETQLEQGSKTKHVPSPYKSYGIGLDPKYHAASKISFDKEKFELFVRKHSEWIHDYALFCALRDHFDTDNWTLWDSMISKKEEHAVANWNEKLKSEILRYIKEQWELHESYILLHKRASEKGIVLIGDIPYYPSFRSSLVWAHQEVFQITADGKMPFVSGIPDTPNTHFGRQVWGHPLYNWDEQKEQVISFWKLRLKYLASIFDHLRFDHAKAFFAYGVIDMANPLHDKYVNGPGVDVFTELVCYAQHHGISIFAEDSGDKTKVLRKAMEEMHIPGLRIFRFAIKGDEVNKRYSIINSYPENSVAYTTTHDTETLLGYIQSLTQKQKTVLGTSINIEYTDDISFAKNLRNEVISSPSKIVIIPMQDWLLTTDRINIPGTEKEIGDTNWDYKLSTPISSLPTKL